MEIHNGFKTFYAKTGAAWRAWLQTHGETEKCVWLILYRKGKGKPSVYYDEAVEEALCFGWIDSKSNKRDEESSYLFFARRNPKSKWSALNKRRVDKLLQEGRMAPQGLAVIENAKQSGTWQALDEVEALTVPKDLQQALKKHKAATEHFNAFPRSVKRGILEWISNAKRPETRQKRIEETATLAADNKRAAQYVKKAL